VKPGVHPAALMWALVFAAALIAMGVMCSGCGGPRLDAASQVQRGGEHPAVVAVIDAWQVHVERYGQLPEIPQRCYDELERIRIAINSDEAQARACRQRANGCYYTTGDTPVLWIRAAITGRTRCRLIAHETVHWLGLCAGVSAYSHSNPRLWPSPWPAIRELVADQCPHLQTPRDVVEVAAERAACGGGL